MAAAACFVNSLLFSILSSLLPSIFCLNHLMLFSLLLGLNSIFMFSRTHTVSSAAGLLPALSYSRAPTLFCVKSILTDSPCRRRGRKPKLMERKSFPFFRTATGEWRRHSSSGSALLYIAEKSKGTCLLCDEESSEKKMGNDSEKKLRFRDD